MAHLIISLKNTFMAKLTWPMYFW